MKTQRQGCARRQTSRRTWRCHHLLLNSHNLGIVLSNATSESCNFWLFPCHQNLLTKPCNSTVEKVWWEATLPFDSQALQRNYFHILSRLFLQVGICSTSDGGKKRCSASANSNVPCAQRSGNAEHTYLMTICLLGS